jgi:hypothetical protein
MSSFNLKFDLLLISERIEERLVFRNYECVVGDNIVGSAFSISSKQTSEKLVSYITEFNFQLKWENEQVYNFSTTISNNTDLSNKQIHLSPVRFGTNINEELNLNNSLSINSTINIFGKQNNINENSSNLKSKPNLAATVIVTR